MDRGGLKVVSMGLLKIREDGGGIRCMSGWYKKCGSF